MTALNGDRRFVGMRSLLWLRCFIRFGNRCLLSAYRILGRYLYRLALHLVVVTRFQDTFSVIGPRVAPGRVVALTTRPPCTTLFQPGPTLSYFTDDSVLYALTAEVLCVPRTLLRSKGAFLASAGFTSFHFAHPRQTALCFPQHLQRLCCCCEMEHSPES